MNYGIAFTKPNYNWKEGYNEVNKDLLTSLSTSYQYKWAAKDAMREHVISGLHTKFHDDCTFNTIINWCGNCDRVTFNVGNGEETARIVSILDVPFSRESDSEKKIKNGYVNYIRSRIQGKKCSIPYTFSSFGGIRFDSGNLSELGVLSIIGFDNVYSYDGYQVPAMLVQSSKDFNWYIIHIDDLPYSLVEKIAKGNFNFGK